MKLYSERLHPGPGALIASAGIGGAFGLIAVPFSTTLAIIIVIALAIATPLAFWFVSPLVTVSRQGTGPTGVELTFSHAHIDLGYLGQARVLDADALRLRIPDVADGHIFHGHSPFVRTAIEVVNEDPDDAIDTWIVTTRAPEKLVSVIQEAHSAQTS